MSRIRERSKVPVEAGATYGMLTIVERLPNLKARNGSQRRMWLASCSCGTKRPVRDESLLTGQCKSCGCTQYKRRIADISGQRFGRLVAVRLDESSEGSRRGRRWFVRCDCGVEKSMGLPMVKNQGSCGCRRFDGKINNQSEHPLYGVWAGIKQRCNCPSSSHYADYGGRGITISDRWLDSFPTFVADVGPRPPGSSRGRALWSLDRIDPNGNYEPTNVRWATQTDQCANKRLSRERVAELLEQAELVENPIAWLRVQMLGAA